MILMIFISSVMADLLFVFAFATVTALVFVPLRRLPGWNAGWVPTHLTFSTAPITAFRILDEHDLPFMVAFGTMCDHFALSFSLLITL
jgi:hypothetical protein